MAAVAAISLDEAAHDCDTLERAPTGDALNVPGGSPQLLPPNPRTTAQVLTAASTAPGASRASTSNGLGGELADGVVGDRLIVHT